MKTRVNINEGWTFTMDGETVQVNIPHTWNSDDGQNGGNNYRRGCFTYEKALPEVTLGEGDELYVEFKGVNESAKVYLNGELLGTHAGGYSTFRCNLTPQLITDPVEETVEVTEEAPAAAEGEEAPAPKKKTVKKATGSVKVSSKNVLKVEADNGECETVYPQTADFTFYGGIYRDVNLITVHKLHFDLDYWGTGAIKVDPVIRDGENDARLTVTTYQNGGTVKIEIKDAEGNVVATPESGQKITVADVHRWDGVEDPYLYTAVATLYDGDTAVDEVSTRFGFRSFSVNHKKGFFLNGRSYPLRGVSRHQDRPGRARNPESAILGGYAIGKAEHKEDMDLIKELGANTIRLAHYQHDDYFYDLCDEYGMVVWAEIPYISRHMPEGHDNTISQMTELIYQQYNHPCIVCWGIANEITMKKCDKKDRLQNLNDLNDLCHKLDTHRVTTLAEYAACGPFNKTGKVTDIVSWNFYLGWYTPFLWLNDLMMWFYRLVNPHRCFGYSEYGAEAMTNLHSKKPKRFDNTEEYQCTYHEYMIRFFARSPWMWATHNWNMFDFAADGRNQGGDPGMNHKGLVTFDRKTKKDSFYLYKAYWSKEPVLHLCGQRYINRDEKKTTISVYSNLGENVEIYSNGELVKTLSKPTKKNGKVYRCKIALAEGSNEIVVKCKDMQDGMTINKVDEPDPSYKVHSGNSASWEK